MRLIDEFNRILAQRETHTGMTVWEKGKQSEARGFAQAIDTIVCNGVSEKNKDISLSELNEIRMLAKKEGLIQ